MPNQLVFVYFILVSCAQTKLLNVTDQHLAVNKQDMTEGTEMFGYDHIYQL